ncbi:MAG TPA: proprotein convertase P-domain-containing protein [Kofleriaceae bacterium]|nr:proprotein convertase P-domain-containing protein [Kofleriaceae bacterium]
MKGVHKVFGLCLVGSVHLLAGCATEDASECLPGDIDCAAPETGDGKADGWNGANDPRRMAQRLNYRLSELPKRGKLTTPVWKQQYPSAPSAVAWADTYWPTAEGSHNNRWQGAGVKSPLEKYDAVFNNTAGCDTQPSSVCGSGAKAAWDAYYGCAGPAAKWQSKEFQSAGKQHDGIDNNSDGSVDECNGSDGNDGVATWWGTCHAWSPAALLAPEPQHAVTLDGVTFEVADIKALIQNAYDRTSAVMLGGRCNAKEIEHTVTGSANDECSDVNPGALHVILTNFLGINQMPLVEDRTANFEVWNQPVLGYQVTQQREVSKTAANECVGSSETRKWTYNPDAKKLYEVRVTVDYLVEGYAEARPVGFANNTSQDDYHYILELNSDGKVIGGRYCTDSTNSHIDFLWSPTGNHSPSNPYVKLDKVNELIAKSVAPASSGGGGSAVEFAASPNAAIPDNDPAGVTVDVPVSGLTGTPGLSVSVDIAHTYRGDLVVTLLKDGVEKKTLHDGAGGGEDNLVQTYTLSAAEVGASPNGRWQLEVVDTASQDTGTVKSVKLSFE